MTLYKVRRDFDNGMSQWLHSYDGLMRSFAWVDSPIDAMPFTTEVKAREVMQQVRECSFNDYVRVHLVEPT